MNYLNEKGRIFDIQRFSVHDGPGIRTIIFLKGCMLRCKWCCNPESQEYAIQSMVTDGKTKIIGRDVTVRELLEDITKDRVYYRRSGGGVTLSGGECFCQPEFSKAILQASKENGINTAVESTSCVDYLKIKPALEYIDYYLMDIKHMNSAKHKEYTGIGNERILENAKLLAKDAKNLTIRVPVIPGVNDSDEQIRAISEFTASLGTVKELHLLPYHRLGTDKYNGLGRTYEMAHAQLHTSERIEELKFIAERTGLTVLIGG